MHQRDHESDETSQGPSNGSDPVRVDETLLSCWIGLLQELIVQWHLDHGGADPDDAAGADDARMASGPAADATYARYATLRILLGQCTRATGWRRGSDDMAT